MVTVAVVVAVASRVGEKLDEEDSSVALVRCKVQGAKGLRSGIQGWRR